MLPTIMWQIGQPMLPLDHNLFNFGSWMGGDRDGNPFVTPETTRDVVITARLSAVNLYFSTIEKLLFELSIWRSNKELMVGTPGSKTMYKACMCRASLYSRCHTGQSYI